MNREVQKGLDLKGPRMCGTCHYDLGTYPASQSGEKRVTCRVVRCGERLWVGATSIVVVGYRAVSRTAVGDYFS